MGIRTDVVAVGLAAAVAGAGVGAWQNGLDKVYGASATMQVTPAPASVVSTGVRADNMVFLAHRYAADILSRPALAAAVAASGLRISTDEAQNRTSVSVSATDATLHIDTTGPSRADATALDKAVTQVAIQRVTNDQQSLRDAQLAPLDAEIADLRTQIAQDRNGSAQWLADQQQYRTLLTDQAAAQAAPTDQLNVLSPALAHDKPIAPHPVRTGILAFLVAAAVLGQIAVWRQARRRRKTTTPTPAADVYPEPSLTRPVIANVPAQTMAAVATAPEDIPAVDAEMPAVRRMRRAPRRSVTATPARAAASD